MTSCARGCCFTGLQVCARSYTCACHPTPLTEWLGTRADEPAVRRTHADPTGNQAVNNIMRQQRKGKS